jgi:hypothetical protein
MDDGGVTARSSLLPAGPAIVVPGEHLPNPPSSEEPL